MVSKTFHIFVYPFPWLATQVSKRVDFTCNPVQWTYMLRFLQSAPIHTLSYYFLP